MFQIIQIFFYYLQWKQVNVITCYQLSEKSQKYFFLKKPLFVVDFAIVII